MTDHNRFFIVTGGPGSGKSTLIAALEHVGYACSASPEIFRQDSERKQTFDEAVRTHDALAATYRESGYELVALPKVPVSERLRFVVEENWLT